MAQAQPQASSLHAALLPLGRLQAHRVGKQATPFFRVAIS